MAKGKGWFQELKDASKGQSAHRKRNPDGLARIDVSEIVTELIPVVGESFRQSEISAAVGRRGQEAVKENVEVFLWADAGNEHDRNLAVAVAIGEHHVGYLSREDAERYNRAVYGAPLARAVLVAPARVTAAAPGQYETTNAGVTAAMPSPEEAEHLVQEVFDRAGKR